MSDRSKIEWTDATWNPVTGCTPVSEGCANCYAKRMATRLRGRFGYPADDPFRVTLHPERLEEPFRWRKPRRVFVCSMGDLFHEDVPYEFIRDVFDVMRDTYRCGHTYMVLTKRPQRMRDFIARLREDRGPDFVRWPSRGLPHIWLGVTAENQARADERIPILLQVPAAVRFVSVEPMLEAVDLSHWLTCACNAYWPGQGHHPECPTQNLHWVICGGETGPGARPMHPDWVRSLRDQCQAAGVPFFFKQWGEWAEIGKDEVRNTSSPALYLNSAGDERFVDPPDQQFVEEYDTVAVARLGRKLTGRLLDGRTWDEMPEVRA